MARKLTTALAALLIVSAGAVQAQEASGTAAEGSWIHVRVDESEGEQVKLDLPLTMVDVALQMGGEKGLGANDLRLGPDSDVTVQDLRRMWAELRKAPDANFVDIRDGEERVRVSKRDGRVHVDVEEDGRQTVRVELPATVVDALLSGEGDRLNLKAAARELGRTGNQQIVRIDDRETQVRIWVDDRPGTGDAPADGGSSGSPGR